MVQAGFLAPKRTAFERARRAALGPVLGALIGAGAGACGGSSSGQGAAGAAGSTDVTTIGDYCDELLPVFCQRSIDACGASGSVVTCVENARAVCCQGACSRPARLVDGKTLEACEQAYTAQACSEVAAGLSPAACQDLVELEVAPIDGRWR